MRCRSPRLRGQLRSALGATASKDLAAVGGSHSLAEAVYFGSVELLGLIGTNSCHGFYTSCKNMLNSCLRSRSESEKSYACRTYETYYSGFIPRLSILFCVLCNLVENFKPLRYILYPIGAGPVVWSAAALQAALKLLG